LPSIDAVVTNSWSSSGLPASARLKYLQGYPPDVLQRIASMQESDSLGAWLRGRYAQAHTVRTDRALHDYVQELKREQLRGAQPVSKVVFDNKLHIVKNALGTHTTVSRVQGSQLKSKREIRVASLFKETPIEFLKMIVVHELAHLREREHDKAFYNLCIHMEPAYHQLEFDVRVYLTHLEAGGQALWPHDTPDLNKDKKENGTS
jgi:predicted metal-dependent hydrolase